MFNFKDFNITSERKGYEGDKIKTDRLLNREITVHSYEVVDSIKEIGKKRLDMQISIGDTKYVVFTGARDLIEKIQRVPSDGFPFKTTIVKENDWLKFT